MADAAKYGIKFNQHLIEIFSQLDVDLFENMCIRDLKIYADAMNASLSYFRDKNDFEVDVILRDRKSTRLNSSHTS